MDWTSESEDNNQFSWGSDEEGISCDPSSSRQTVTAGHAANGIVSNGACEAGPSRPRLVTQYMAMGFAEDLVVKAIKEHDVEDEDAILETLLTYSVIEKSSPRREDCKIDPLDSPDASFSNDDFSDMDSFNDEFVEEDSPKEDTKLQALVGMGFTKDEASAAIRRCGLDASISELADSITAAQAAKEYDDRLDELGYQSESALSSSYDDEGRQGRAFDPRRGKKRRSSDYSYVDKKRRLQLKRDHDQSKFGESFDNKLYYGGDAPMVFPNPMVGFGAPNNIQHVSERKLPEAALGIPYFYYENVALTPKGVWETISRFLYGIDPEFVDSKYFCAANRKRGYVHNLPIRNRLPLQPLPPRTINEALPGTKKWWPSWDPRKQLNCLQTCIASAKLTERIRKILSDSDDPPPKSVQEYVLKECRKWNLVWVGLNKVAPLEPDEIEMLLGFPRDHTRGGGISRTDRYKSLGNSFQVDTVAYHLSVLRDLFPNGMNVLSLFSGIGGAEVALHRLGIHMKNVVSVEISEINRNIVRGWWEETGQTGNLYDIDDVQKLTANKLEDMIHRFGGFDLVIGGSPCNNLAGSNRVSRDGLQGEHSSLFFDYFRILDEVKSIMGRNIRR